jgi:hypothetical protein
MDGSHAQALHTSDCAKLRIAIVPETYPPEINGVAMTMAQLVRGLLARGHRVERVRPRQLPGEVPACRGNLGELLVRGVAIPSDVAAGALAGAALAYLSFVLEPLIA